MSRNLSWDGSHLGRIDRRHVKWEDVRDGLNYWFIDYDGHSKFDYMGGNEPFRCICISEPVESRFPCLVDELKPLFCISKTGTHSVMINTKLYLLYLPCIDDDKLIPDVALPEMQIKHKEFYMCSSHVVKIMMFWSMVGCGTMSPYDILIRWRPQHNPLFLSLHERNKKRAHEVSYKKDMQTIWFQEKRQNHPLRSMLLYYFDDISQQINTSDLRDDIQKIVKRVAPEYNNLDVQIWKKICELLETHRPY